MEPFADRSVVIVEDHALTRRFIADHLGADGYTPLQAASLAEGRAVIAESAPALVVLDLGLPDGDGLELLRELRGPIGAEWQLPVIVLSGRGSELDRVRGLTQGADDYLAKPFGFVELRARIEALLRRSAWRPGGGRARVNTLEIDRPARQVWLEGQPVHLSNKEFALLSLLASEPTRTFEREHLMREVWGFHTAMTRTLDSHAYRLRRKLGAGRVSYVINVWGVGYRLVDGPVTC